MACFVVPRWEEPRTGSIDVSPIELVWNRISHTFKASARKEIEAVLGKLRVAADQEDASQAVTYAQDLRGTFADMGWH